MKEPSRTWGRGFMGTTGQEKKNETKWRSSGLRSAGKTKRQDGESSREACWAFCKSPLDAARGLKRKDSAGKRAQAENKVSSVRRSAVWTEPCYKRESKSGRGAQNGPSTRRVGKAGDDLRNGGGAVVPGSNPKFRGEVDEEKGKNGWQAKGKKRTGIG